MPSQSSIVSPGEGPQVEFIPGELMIWKATGATTEGALDCVEVQLEPLVGPREHIHHQQDETFYVLEGDFRFKVGGKLVDTSTGGFVFVARGTPHCWKNIGVGIGRLLIIFTPGGMEGYFQELSPLIRTIIAGNADQSKVDPSILAEADVIMKRYHYKLVGPRLE